MTYELIPFDLSSLIKNNDSRSCYWFEISNAFNVHCDGTCGHDIDLYSHNQTIDMDVIFEVNEANSSIFCDTYFGNNKTMLTTLTSINAIFEHVLSILAANDPFKIYDVVKSPFTVLRDVDGKKSPDCNDSFEILNITSTFYMLSGIQDENEFSAVFADDGPFMSDAQQLLSEFFKVPVALNPLIEEYNTTNGWRTEYFAAVIGGALFIIVVILFAVLYQRRKRQRKRELLTTYINNPMVIAIAIGKYDKNPKKSELPGLVFGNLDAIDNDIKNITSLVGDTLLNYQLFPEYNINDKIRTHWTKKQIIKLLKAKGKKLDKAVKD